ncbi:EpsG family protein [Stutzerimonas stutzeri]|uniref:EpsG family protein n=1 Tax=Stutzerimonas stutzeri TaxID=316 RepID=UPI0015E1A5F1|nr:EpsG family protein [Stutzerimonas stutzeri]MCQ4263735.1 EpsG family protein [Stutzerimonas stutzeri]
MIYLFGWLLCYFFIAVEAISGYKGRFFAFLLVCYFGIVSLLRGSVGTDTANYEKMLVSVTNNYIWDGREPGFMAVAWLLSLIAPSAEIAVRLLSFIFFVVLAIFLIRSDRNERFLLVGYIIPAFAFQYSMNGLRLGLASSILMLAVQQYRINGSLAGIRVAIPSIMFHYSVFFSLSYLIVSQVGFLRVSSLFGLLTLLFFGVAGFFLLDISYVADKFSSYQMMQAPGTLSGVSRVVVVLVFVCGIAISNLPSGDRIRLSVLGLSFLFLFWLLTQYTYAGLRMLDLLCLVCPLAMAVSFARLGLNFNIPIKIVILLAGMLSVFAVYRGFLLESGLGSSPFLPYEFISLPFEII